MDRCNKFKLFSCLLIFCSINIFLYRHFSQPEPHLVSGSETTQSKRTHFELYSTVVKEATNMQSVPSNTQKFNSIDSSNRWYSNDNRINHHVPKTYFIQPRNNTDSTPGSDPLSPPHTVPPYQNTLTNYLYTWSLSNAKSETTAVGDVLLATHPANQTLCPMVPPRLNGRLATYMEPYSWEEIARENPGLQSGGRYKPLGCQARHRVAIIIPYRNRDEHLKILLRNLHPILSRQQLDYGIFVIEQALPGKFNRAMLMNIGYVEAMKRYNYQCAVFHDVDLVPENDRNIYSCPEMPRHMSAAIDKFNYRLPYSGIYGGVSAVNKEQFEKLNGFSNMFFGWGGEDDDMAKRIKTAKLKITRYPMEIARYKMIKHVHDSGNERNPMRFALLKSTPKRMEIDGLNSLVYYVQEVEELPTHLRIQVLIKEGDILRRKPLVS